MIPHCLGEVHREHKGTEAPWGLLYVVLDMDLICRHLHFFIIKLKKIESATVSVE